MGALSLQGLCAIAVCAAAQRSNMAALGTGTKPKSVWLLSMALHGPIQTQLGMVLEKQYGLKQGEWVIICT